MALIFNTNLTVRNPVRIIVDPNNAGSDPTVVGQTEIWNGTGIIGRLVDISGSSVAGNLQGANANDTLIGSVHADRIDGGGGADSLYSSFGRDTILGGEGADVIRTRNLGTDASDGGDHVEGGAGADTIIAGGKGNEILAQDDNDLIDFGLGTSAGGAGQSVIDGGGGNDTVVSVGDGNKIYGDSDAKKSGSDSISSVGNAVAIYGYGGNDTIVASGSSGFVSAGEGDDRVTLGRASGSVTGFDGIVKGEGGNDTIDGSAVSGKLDLSGGAGKDSLAGGNGADTLDGGAGNDTVLGGAGDDTAIWFWGEGADSYAGGEGKDTLWIDFRDPRDYAAQSQTMADLVNIFASGPPAGSNAVGTLSYSGFESVVVSIGGLVVKSSLSPGTAPGGWYLQPAPTPQSDKVQIYRVGVSQGAIDWTSGEAGDDIYVMASRSETVPASVTDKRFSGGAGNDTMFGLDRNDRLDGGEGNDLVIGGAGNDSLTGGAGHDTLDGGDGNDILSHFPDLGFKGLGSASRFYGGGGADSLYGREGDVLDAGDGNDMLVLDGAVTAAGGAGNDLFVSVLVGANGIPGSTAADLLTPPSALANLTAGDKKLDGGAGNDTILGGSGEDSIDGGWDSDRLYGGGGADSMIGGAGDDRVFGGTGDDTLFGGSGYDIVSGDEGDDLLLTSADWNLGSGYFFTFTGNGQVNYLYSAASVAGLTATSDSYSGGSGQDTLLGTAGRDAIYAVQNFMDAGETITGVKIVGVEVYDLGAGDDVADLRRTINGATVAGDPDVDRGATVAGKAGNDVLLGSENDDWLYGGSGNDTMAGDGGWDRFIFADKRTAGPATSDLIVDFSGKDGIYVLGSIDAATFRKDSDFEGPGVVFSPDSLGLMTRLSAGNASAFLSRVTTQGSDTILTLKSGDTITLAGVSKADLKAWDMLGSGW